MVIQWKKRSLGIFKSGKEVLRRERWCKESDITIVISEEKTIPWSTSVFEQGHTI